MVNYNVINSIKVLKCHLYIITATDAIVQLVTVKLLNALFNLIIL